MKNLFEINRSEKNRILEMHHGATKNMYLSKLNEESIVSPFENKMAAKVSKGGTSTKVSFGTKRVGRFSKKQTTNKKSKNYKKPYRGQGR